jgi:outer membrane immunogenic protein
MKANFAGGIVAFLAAAVAAAPAAAEGFNGFQLGVTAGYNHDKVGPAFEDALLTHAVSRDSAMVGIFAGYDLTIGTHFVIGGEAALNGPADNKLRNDRGIVRTTIDPRLAVYVSARAGYLVNDRTLLYVRAGCATIRTHTSTVQAAVISSSLDGWHAGAGVEYALGKHVNARVEYRYTDVGGSKTSYKRQQALVGLAYRF